jgi:hypothetical protein
MWLLLPIDITLNKLAEEGFLKNYKRGGRIIPNSIPKWIFLNHHSIISQYNWLITGLYNYYSVANNLYAFHLIINYILRHSCAKTLARKFRLGSRAAVFKKFGKHLTTKGEPYISLRIPDNYKRLTKWPNHSFLPNPYDFLNWKLRTQLNYWDKCQICDSDKKIEVHHVKHIRKSNLKTKGFTKLMSMLNRKQIALCHDCHGKVHMGIYDGISLTKLKKS